MGEIRLAIDDATHGELLLLAKLRREHLRDAAAAALARGVRILLEEAERRKQ